MLVLDRQAKQRWFRGALFAGAVSLQLLLPGIGYALDPARGLLQYNCQTWGRPNGLPANGINAITQTTDGYLWLGTAIGLVRFDGIEFKVLDLGRVQQARSSIVNSLCSAKEGGLWVGLENSSFGFCDGHTELHKWKSNVFYLNEPPGIRTIPSIGSPQYNDWYWLAWHASRKLSTGTIP